MPRLGVRGGVLAGLVLALALGAAPAAPSYYEVERTVKSIRDAWSKAGAPAEPNAPGWNAFFDAVLAELHAESTATTENARLSSLNRLYEMSVALRGVSWEPAQTVRESLRAWLRPRVRLAWAERRLVDHVRQLASTADPAVTTNRQRWVDFVGTELGKALNDYDAASTVAQRQTALKQVYGALNSLQATNRTRQWVPSLTLETALNDLYNLPNLDISADLATVTPVLSQNMVENGPIYRKGYISQVTAGPKTGFGLLASDEGIAFYNSQLATSVTPIHDFQQQIAADRRGRRAAKMYQFSATSVDESQITMTAVLSPNGLSLYPQYQHNTNAMITSLKQPGGAMGRFIASLIGMNQAKITQKVYDGAIGKMRENVVKEAAELGGERAAAAQAQENAKLAEYLLFGRDAGKFRNLIIYQLSLRSRPENVMLGGVLNWLGASQQVGADAPQPQKFAVPETGVSADLHLSSIITSLVRGYLQSDDVRGIQNVMLVTRKVAPGAPPREAFAVSTNVDFAGYVKAVKDARAANDPKIVALRVKRPSAPPEFAADARGYLVGLIHDLELDVPAPAQAAQGGFGPPAQVYRIVAPHAEVVVDFEVAPESEKTPIRFAGRVVEFEFGPGSKVLAINEDESKAEPLTAFTSMMIQGVMRTKLTGQPIDVPLSNLQLRGFAIRSVSKLEPSGWVRVNLERTTQSTGAGIH